MQPNSSSRFWVIVPAAGVGSRMNSTIPKQYLRLNGKTILEHTLARLLLIPNLAGVVVAVGADDSYWNALSVSQHPLIFAVEGGAERAHSVHNGLSFLADKVTADDWVLVHDAARPCVTVACITKMCDLLSYSDVGGILAVPVSDTIKRVSNGNTIANTVDRHLLWQAQTPQMFRYRILYDSLSACIARGDAVTDEASALELCGYEPLVVEGRTDNIKITRADDLALAEFILHKQSEQEM